MLSVPSCSVPVSVISPSWHFSQQGPTRSRSPALPGSPALSGPEPNRGAAASPGRDCPPLAGRRYRGGRALPAQPGWKLPLLPGLLHGTAGAGGPVRAQLTQPGEPPSAAALQGRGCHIILALPFPQASPWLLQLCVSRASHVFVGTWAVCF